MKKIILACLMILAVAACLTAAEKKESPLETFIRKAQVADKDIEVFTAKLEKMKLTFAATGAKIQALKDAKQETGFKGFLQGLKLKYYLSKGNSQGYRIYKLEAGIRELKEDYFTYVSLIAEEYGARIRACFDKKCPELVQLYEKRKEWAGAADKYGDQLQMDLSSLGLIKNYSKAAAKDVKDYLQKKTVQAEQRIYMLEEENGILDIMKKAGAAGVAADKKKVSGKAAELKKLKKKLQDEMAKIK